MVRRLLPLLPLLVTGCASAPPVIRATTPVEVKIPVYYPVYCSASLPERPKLPIGALSARSEPAETIKAYAASVVILKGAVSQRDAIIEGCAQPPISPDNTTNAATAHTSSTSNITNP
jgi:hypothetical protein